jgi:hypothetical protein
LATEKEQKEQGYWEGHYSLIFSEKDPWNAPEQDGLARSWKASRQEKRSSKKYTS